MIKSAVAVILTVVFFLVAFATSQEGDIAAGGGQASTTRRAASQPATAPAICVVIFDFAGGDYGKALADSIRLRLRRYKDWQVVDRLTTQEFSSPVGVKVGSDKVAKLMGDLACRMAVFGTVRKTGREVSVEVRCIDSRNPKRSAGWVKTFADSSQRSRAVISRKIAEALRNRSEWVPPQYGDEPEPKKFGKCVNVNGDFEKGRLGWDAPDRVSTFLEKDDSGRGTILRVRTDLERDPWLAYRKKLRLGQTDPSKAPKIARDTSYGCVGGLEGVHYRSEWIKATPGRRYWLLADCKGLTSGIFFPKVFVKGFKDWSSHADGLPESSLAAMGLTPDKFASLPEAKRKELISADVKKHPEAYRRECYRWYLACRCEKGRWKHFAAPFPPRGGLPKNVQWLQIQIYSYWPPGEYLWDNVMLYKDPRQKKLAPPQPARTPNFDKR